MTNALWGALALGALCLPATAGFAAPKPPASTDPDLCLKDDAHYVGPADKQVFRVTITNICKVRFGCDVHTNVTTPMGTSLGHARILVPKGTPKRPAGVTHIFPTKGGATVQAQESKTCVAR